MAFYDYTCPGCGEFVLWRRMDERDQPAECPNCHAHAFRLMAAPRLNLMPAGRRQAFARNEKSQHEPGVTKRHRCGSGCGCGSSKNKSSKATRTVDLGKTGRFEALKKQKRPWMLGH